ncbi:MAG: hypothetical protein Q8P60_06835 [Pseudorhodobacter sp.]|nr:hypothetical protein [Pseudorhodobacter sp.]
MPNAETRDGRALEAALDRMHQAVLAGEFENVAALEPKIEALISGLTELTDRSLSQRLASKAARNATCLQAAARGLRAALRRLAEIRSACDGLQTYDGLGKRAEVRHSVGRLAQRL